MTDEDLDRSLRERLRLGLDGITGGRRGIDRLVKGKAARDQGPELQDLVEWNREALAWYHRGSAPRLVVFHHGDRAAEMHVRIPTSVVKLLWGGLEIVQSRLPKDTHGPTGALPGGRGLSGNGKQAQASERSALRVAGLEEGGQPNPIV